ncbi:MAG: HAD family phosphatase [Armatimonadetes bacterium]|nr:HAD family phosphatase [Armatimonadota bacterium]
MTRYRLAAVDLDDTLLGADKIISRANYEAIHRLVDAGVTVVLASGRRHENMSRFYRNLHLSSGWMVSCNGAMARNEVTGETIWEQRLPQPLVRAILADGEAFGVTQNFYHAGGELFVNATNEWTQMYVSRTNSELTAIPDIMTLADDPALKIIWITAAENALELGDRMREKHGETALHIVITDPEYLEFMMHGVNKASGLAHVAERLGFAPSECVAFGDGNNDVEMLEWAGLGIAMPHARLAAQQAADVVSPDGDPETAFARAVEMLFSR